MDILCKHSDRPIIENESEFKDYFYVRKMIKIYKRNTLLIILTLLKILNDYVTIHN